MIPGPPIPTLRALKCRHSSQMHRNEPLDLGGFGLGHRADPRDRLTLLVELCNGLLESRNNLAEHLAFAVAHSLNPLKIRDTTAVDSPLNRYVNNAGKSRHINGYHGGFGDS